MANSYGLPLASALTSFLASTVSIPIAQAQSVVPNDDGIGTVVTKDGSQFNIEQGTLSSDRTNQFHSFESFSLSTTDSANFISPTDVQNIFARINGTNPSVIDGLLQITDSGSDPNLYLINPTGILLGPNASLNLPASFTATTAHQIGFEQGWLDAKGTEAIDAISGPPTGDFLFTLSDPDSGAIVNEADLAVHADENIALIGTSITNIGQLTAPGGSITLAAAPENTQVQMRRPNDLVTLEFNSVDASLSAFSPTDIPALLTHSEQVHATGLAIADDGSATLTNEPAPSSSFSTGTLFSSGSLNTNSPSSGGDIALVGRTVVLEEATISASGITGGGVVRIGGDYRGQDTLFAADNTLVNAGTSIAADAISSGDGGRVVVWADDTAQYFGEISATGGTISGNGGFVEVSGKRNLTFEGAVNTRAPNGDTGMLLIDPENINIINGRSAADDEHILDGHIAETDGLETDGLETGGLETDGSENDNGGLLTISEGTLAGLSGATNVTLEASNNITVAPLNDRVLAFAPGTGDVVFRADADSDGVGDIIMSDRETTLIAPGRNVTLSGANLQLGDINTVSTARSLQSGDVTIQASGAASLGSINTFSYLLDGQSGDVSVTAAEITSGDISTVSLSQAGDVTLIGQLGTITTGEISSAASNGRDGETTLTAPLGITVDGTIVQAPPSITTTEVPPSIVSSTTNTSQTETSQTEPSQTESDIPNETSLNLDLLSLGALSAIALSNSDAGGKASDTEEHAFTASQSVVLSSAEANEAIAQTESVRTNTFANYFKRELNPSQSSLEEIQRQLSASAKASGSHSAFIYVEAPTERSSDQASSPLEMMIITAENPAVKVTVPHVSEEAITTAVTSFRNQLFTSARRGNHAYLSDAQQLYAWLIAPIEAALAKELKDVTIDTFAFAMDDALRTLPIAALHDGEQFLVEKYGVGTLPSVGLTNLDYVGLEKSEVIAMGVSEFEDKASLPGVALEIESIGRARAATTFLNENFTKAALEQRKLTPYQIVHLATHAEFKEGTLSDSYIQLWDEKLSLDELAALGWDAPMVELLVLSACSTALGSSSAELGFAGIAVASGVRSAIATLWPVDDLGTLALMSELYKRLGTHPTKATALQSAQLALLRDEIDISQADDLPADLKQALRERTLAHPYYWSGFTLIGNPW